MSIFCSAAYSKKSQALDDPLVLRFQTTHLDKLHDLRDRGPGLAWCHHIQAETATALMTSGWSGQLASTTGGHDAGCIIPLVLSPLVAPIDSINGWNTCAPCFGNEGRVVRSHFHKSSPPSFPAAVCYGRFFSTTKGKTLSTCENLHLCDETWIFAFVLKSCVAWQCHAAIASN